MWGFGVREAWAERYTMVLTLWSCRKRGKRPRGDERSGHIADQCAGFMDLEHCSLQKRRRMRNKNLIHEAPYYACTMWVPRMTSRPNKSHYLHLDQGNKRKSCLVQQPTRTKSTPESQPLCSPDNCPDKYTRLAQDMDFAFKFGNSWSFKLYVSVVEHAHFVNNQLLSLLMFQRTMTSRMAR